MSDRPRTTAERWARFQRDQETYRRISLARRSHARFRRDLAVVPHLFLLPGRARMAALMQPPEAVRAALRGEAIWTLDTAARLLTGEGFIVSPDLTGYLNDRSLERAVEQGLIGTPMTGGLTIDPLYHRPPMLLAHLADDPPPPFTTLPSGDRVVTWQFLIRDIFGTLGWRPDLLTVLEARRPIEVGVAQQPPP
ncbi:MAG TPA: hypothetical protein VN970_07075 [Thermoanaerobaculia bacterium]|nr:hypothetical protein [Thermoanaerobaculia bacterium]